MAEKENLLSKLSAIFEKIRLDDLHPNYAEAEMLTAIEETVAQIQLLYEYERGDLGPWCNKDEVIELIQGKKEE